MVSNAAKSRDVIEPSPKLRIVLAKPVALGHQLVIIETMAVGVFIQSTRPAAGDKEPTVGKFAIIDPSASGIHARLSHPLYGGDGGGRAGLETD